MITTIDINTNDQTQCEYHWTKPKIYYFPYLNTK